MKKRLIKQNSGYVACLPEYEGDLTATFDFSKKLTLKEVLDKEQKKVKKKKVA